MNKKYYILKKGKMFFTIEETTEESKTSDLLTIMTSIILFGLLGLYSVTYSTTLFPEIILIIISVVFVLKKGKSDKEATYTKDALIIKLENELE